MNVCLTCKVIAFVPNELGRCPTCEQTPGLHTVGNRCESRCGDSIVYNGIESCDDGNALDGDGCNKQCQVEKFWFCKDGVCKQLPKPPVSADYSDPTTKNEISLLAP